MSRTISLDPVTRIEGHLAIKIEVEQGKISDAWSKGEMFRGLETILKGRSPLDAQQITQRICGVCPISHGIASIKAQDMAYGITLPENGRLVRNLIQAANLIQSHVIHFYHLSALDFVDITAILKYQGKEPALVSLKQWVNHQIQSKALLPAAPFLPRMEGDYLQDLDTNLVAIKNYVKGLDIRSKAQQMGALFCGKMPHATALVPGGITEQITVDKITKFRSILSEIRNFVDNCYIPDVLAVASKFPQYFNLGRGCANFLSFGVFPQNNEGRDFFPSGVITGNQLSSLDQLKIKEENLYSLYEGRSSSHPLNGASTIPAPHKSDAYSWIKAPRYDGTPMEVGPLARVLVAYQAGSDAKLQKMVNALLEKFNAPPAALLSVMGRHAARAIETKIVADQCEMWLDSLKPEAPAFQDFVIPKNAEGFGLTEAPRGALGHWIRIENHKISEYQCVVPTTWNCSPRDNKGVLGPVEQALVGTSVDNEDSPIEAARIVRSFDPCIACAVH
jgi:ferredoxin hydrogenase large subunit/hydrogenase large subunit